MCEDILSAGKQAGISPQLTASEAQIEGEKWPSRQEGPHRSRVAWCIHFAEGGNRNKGLAGEGGRAYTASE